MALEPSWANRIRNDGHAGRHAGHHAMRSHSSPDVAGFSLSSPAEQNHSVLGPVVTEAQEGLFSLAPHLGGKTSYQPDSMESRTL